MLLDNKKLEKYDEILQKYEIRRLAKHFQVENRQYFHVVIFWGASRSLTNFWLTFCKEIHVGKKNFVGCKDKERERKFNVKPQDFNNLLVISCCSLDEKIL